MIEDEPIESDELNSSQSNYSNADFDTFLQNAEEKIHLQESNKTRRPPNRYGFSNLFMPSSDKTYNNQSGFTKFRQREMDCCNEERGTDIQMVLMLLLHWCSESIENIKSM